MKGIRNVTVSSLIAILVCSCVSTNVLGDGKSITGDRGQLSQLEESQRESGRIAQDVTSGIDHATKSVAGIRAELTDGNESDSEFEEICREIRNQRIETENESGQVEE